MKVSFASLRRIIRGSGTLRKRWPFFLLIAVLTIVFINGIVQLMIMRLQSGDVYPEYSTLRTDPFGAKAFYESLEGCCGLTVARNYKPFAVIKSEVDAVIVFAGAQHPRSDKFPKRFLEEFESFIQNGGRMVVTYAPPPKPSLGSVLQEEEAEDEEEEVKKEKEDQKDKTDKEDEKKSEKKGRIDPEFVSFSDRWGIEYKRYPLEGATRAVLSSAAANQTLPKEVTWHSPVYFELQGKEWNVIYTREGKPVVIERNWGKGNVALVSDSYFLSNEAMLRERHPGLLAWIVASKKRVIFDEYLHGISEQPGVAALARKYRLQWFVAGLLVLAFLFVWKSSYSLVPPYTADGAIQAAGLSQGKDSTSGLMNLLRRSIPADQIFNVCYREWKKIVKAQDVRVRGKLERIDAAAESASRIKNGAEVYNVISRILKER